MKTKESRKHLFAVGMAALGLAFVTLFTGCQMEGGVDPVESRALGSVSAISDLTGTTWLARLNNAGISRLDFTSTTAATGVFGNSGNPTPLAFTYIFDVPSQTGTLTQTGTGYNWKFVASADNTLTFADGLYPYSDQGASVDFSKIAIQSGISLADLTGTNWLGVGPRGESYMYNFTYDSVNNVWNLTGAFGPDAPNPFTMTYTYNSTTKTGSGTMSSGAGAFTTSDASDTMVFANFWGHGVTVTFNLIAFQ